MDNTVINFLNGEQNVIEVGDEADVPQEIDNDDEFPVDPRLITKTKTSKNLNISIFLKYLLSILIIIKVVSRGESQLAISLTPAMQAETPISHFKEKLSLTSGLNTPMKNPVRAYSNLKRKSVLVELGEALEMMMEQEEKRQKHQDMEKEATRCLPDENVGV